MAQTPMNAIYSPVIVPTEHEKSEWSRLAQAAYAVDRNDLGAKFSVSAACCGVGQSIPLHRFDELRRIYRQWLISGFSAVTF